MRMTLTIDDKLAKAVEEFQKKKNMSLKECINHLLQAGLEAMDQTITPSRYKGQVFDSELQPGIDSNRLNQLADEISFS